MAWARRYDGNEVDAHAGFVGELEGVDVVVGFELPPAIKRVIHAQGVRYISFHIHALRFLPDLCLGAVWFRLLWPDPVPASLWALFATGTIRRSEPRSGHELISHHMLKIAPIKELAPHCEVAEPQLKPGQAELSRRADSRCPHPAADPACVPRATGLGVLGLVQPCAPR